MAQRKKVSRKGSRRLFTAVGNRTQSINLQQPLIEEVGDYEQCFISF